MITLFPKHFQTTAETHDGRSGGQLNSYIQAYTETTTTTTTLEIGMAMDAIIIDYYELFIFFLVFLIDPSVVTIRWFIIAYTREWVRKKEGMGAKVQWPLCIVYWFRAG